MHQELAAILNNADNGDADALTLRPRTLWLILNELKNMCVSTDGAGGIKCTPVTNGAPGFWLRVAGSGDNLIYYVQNGALKAGYFSVVDEPDAPGL